MAEFKKVAELSSLDDGEMIGVELDGENILIANVDGEIYAVSDLCTHEEVLLSWGWLDEKQVECSAHSSLFDITDGNVVGPPAEERLTVYQTRVEGDDILLGPPAE